MDLSKILAEIDAEIESLRKARELLRVAEAPLESGKRKSIAPAKSAASKAKKRVLSPEARRAIAEAQKRRWASAKKEKLAKGGGTGDGGFGFPAKGHK